ncbi:putative ATP-dependent endonuclease of the OLD family [Rhodomicrobium vannielii ATCC 17100]|uniref:Putative ATP-dependent endonuclease of the OLD family n=1 Tax=Rhodomicrobium vannielii (strain ATCC 17100 / DSM 162 / LMG 4299 / NCIMB 10020 / ATH 3.1.1) TaxID=648757 RepID=E3I795_RHOVT|nr:AAA family ATPase [Rhodomicrobium vannielii]ADP70746.1 putative ATP-dependent endonuclease of the OLD family [Rhodomicrobium vannielii ATCC 17100]
MYIEKVKIKNFKCFEGWFEVDFDQGVNIIVGNNEAGKSTLLEAIHLCLTGMLNGKYLRNELSPYLFNRNIERAYLDSLATKAPLQPPEIQIELFLDGEDDALEELRGNGNSEKNDKARGLLFSIEFDKKYDGAYTELLKGKEINSIPLEFYQVQWSEFSRQPAMARTIPIKSALIDSTSTRVQSGSDMYISRIVREFLDDKERVAISQAHRKLKDAFKADGNVGAINERLAEAAKISRKKVSISVDMSSHNAWESSLMTYIEDVPFHYIGKGEQCIVKTRLALSSKKNSEATVLLIEEPENHLSHSKLNQLISDISTDNSGKQVIITTHSSFVANKLGLDHLILLREAKVTRIKDLDASDFFHKLPGYDTLRLVLSQKSILVEGDADELVVQRAYMDANGGKLPIDDEIDVISVGLSFLRFLELATALKIPVVVATDNDGDTAALEKKYAKYKDVNHITICYDPVVDKGDLVLGGKPFNYNTLEPKLVKSNSVETFNTLFSTKHDLDNLHRYMKNNKTECALAIFSAKIKITYPKYILDAIAK